MAWIDCWERQPDKDGEYIVQTVFDSAKPILYTTEGGWNTYIDSNGDLHNEKMISETHVLRWLEVDPVPDPPEWARIAWRYGTWEEWNNDF